MSKERRIPVMEIFGPTIQGEGLMAGTLTSFVRTGGCGLRCSWCDTMYAVDPKQIRAGRTLMTTGEIYNAICSLPPAPYVTFSGGDPCLHETLGEITPALNLKGIKVAVETQGQLFPEWLKLVDVITISPKGPSSGNVVDYHKISEWIYATWGVMRRPVQICIKVVCFDDDDIKYALKVYARIHPQLYDSFYFTAGSAITDPSVPPPSSAEVAEARGIQRIMGIVSGQRWLADKILMLTGRYEFNDKVHIGAQQHVLMWPEVDRGR